METVTFALISNPGPTNYQHINCIIGMSGKMWINPTQEDLEGESFAMIKCYHNISNVPNEEVLERWNKNEKFEFTQSGI